MNRFQKSAIVAALALAAVACQDPVDKAAKARIFSPEDPPKVVASAAEKLPPEDVADSPRVARRILAMDASEVTERLGPHSYKATVTYESDESYGFGAPEWTKQTEESDLYLSSVTVTEEGGKLAVAIEQ